jgi:hypothetical protein
MQEVVSSTMASTNSHLATLLMRSLASAKGWSTAAQAGHRSEREILVTFNSFTLGHVQIEEVLLTQQLT